MKTGTYKLKSMQALLSTFKACEIDIFFSQLDIDWENDMVIKSSLKPYFVCLILKNGLNRDLTGISYEFIQNAKARYRDPENCLLSECGKYDNGSGWFDKRIYRKKDNAEFDKKGRIIYREFDYSYGECDIEQYYTYYIDDVNGNQTHKLTATYEKGYGVKDAALEIRFFDDNGAIVGADWMGCKFAIKRYFLKNKIELPLAGWY